LPEPKSDPSAFVVSALLQELRTTPPELSAAEAASLAEHHLPFLAAQIVRPRVTKSRARYALLAAALVAAGALLWLRQASNTTALSDKAVRIAAVEGEVQVARHAAWQTLTLDRELSAGDGLELASGARLTLDVEQRYELALSERAKVKLEQLSAAADMVRLLAGKAHFSVTKREGPLTVISPHLKIAVTGTRFVVIAEVERSCVSVEEGSVTVAYIRKPQTVALHAGQALSSDGIACGGVEQPLKSHDAPDTERPDLLRLDELPTTPGRASSGKPRASAIASSTWAEQTSSTLAEQTSSTLAEQNALLELAISARRGARYGEARSTLRHLLRRFPETPLRAAAEEELKRVTDLEKR
jgi:hypothetical protein